MVLLVALIWMNQAILSATDDTRMRIHAHYTEVLSNVRAMDETFIDHEMDILSQANMRSMMSVTALFAFAAAIMFSNFHYMRDRAQQSELPLGRATTLMYTDALTGVKSKYAWTMRELELDEEISSRSRDAFALLVCDLNGLKHINDTRGHKAGDEYIRAAARLICEVFAHSPVFRVGGDEFVVMLTDRDFDHRDALQTQFNRIVEENIARDRVVVSMGAALFNPAVDRKVQQVFARADSEMYRRKQALKAMGAKVRE